MTKPPSARLKIFLKPGASATRIVGWVGDELGVSVRERPIENRANLALVAALAEALDVPPSSLKIASGTTSRHKTIEVAGRTQEWLQQRVSAASERGQSPDRESSD